MHVIQRKYFIFCELYQVAESDPGGIVKTLVSICYYWNGCESKLLSVTCGITPAFVWKKCWQGNSWIVCLGAEIVQET